MLLLGGRTPALAASPHSFRWEPVEDSPAIYWPQRRLPAPESLLQVSLDEARANAQALFNDQPLAEFRLAAASEEGLLCARGVLPGQVLRLVTSRDGGKTWKSVWFKAPQEYTFRLQPVSADILALAFDPRDPERVILGTTVGLYQNGQTINPRPPSALQVAAVALHPQNPDLLFMASRPAGPGVPANLSGRGFFRRRVAGDRGVWDDLTPNLPGQVVEIGFDLQDSSQVYVRTEEGPVYRQSVPAQFRPEDFGWETVQTMPAKPKEEAQKTAVARLLRVSPTYAGSFVRMPLEAHGGLLYGWTGSATTGMRFVSLFVSRTGGFDWEGAGGFSGIDDDVFFSRLKVFYNGRRQALVLGDGLPGIPSELAGVSAYDPLDPATLYLTQAGRGLIYRSQDMKTWEDLSQGLDPTLYFTEIAVDSSAALYARAGSLILRKQGTPHPFRLAETRLWPDTLSAGSSLTLSARPVAQAGASGGFVLSAEVNKQRYPLADRGDGFYETQIQIGRDYPLGFDGATLFLEVPGQPLSRVSQYLPFMVVSPEHVPIYADGAAPEWGFQLADGSMDLAAANPFAGKSALQLEGRMTCQYSGTPIHPFGYVLEFYVASADTSAISGLTINEQAVVGLASLRETKGAWTHIEIPAERLNSQPGLSKELFNGYHILVPAYLTELRFRSQLPVHLDEIRLRTLHPAPLQLSWRSASIPDSVVAGVPFRLEAAIEFSSIDLAYPPPEAHADLSELGGPDRLPLSRVGDHLFLLSAVLEDGVVGTKSFTLFFSQDTPSGRITKTFSQRVVVLPGADQVIYAEGFGAHWKQGEVLDAAVNPETTEDAFEGSRALKVTGQKFALSFDASSPIQPLGYRALHFAFHPGDASFSTTVQPNFSVKINEHALRLIGDSLAIDMGRREWQELEVPLDQLGLRVPEAIRRLSFSGNLRGTFYLDDIRLVAARPSVLPSTLVAETREETLPQQFRLDPNYPNPFNSNTTFRFALPASARIEMVVYNLAGQKIATLLSGLREAGIYNLIWDGRDEQGRELASGVYLYRLQAGTQVETRKLLLLR